MYRYVCMLLLSMDKSSYYGSGGTWWGEMVGNNNQLFIPRVHELQICGILDENTDADAALVSHQHDQHD